MPSPSGSFSMILMTLSRSDCSYDTLHSSMACLMAGMIAPTWSIRISPSSFSGKVLNMAVHLSVNSFRLVLLEHALADDPSEQGNHTEASEDDEDDEEHRE